MIYAEPAQSSQHRLPTAPIRSTDPSRQRPGSTMRSSWASVTSPLACPISRLAAYSDLSRNQNDDNVDNGIRFNDSISWQKGRNSFKFGVDYRYQQYSAIANGGSTATSASRELRPRQLRPVPSRTEPATALRVSCSGRPIRRRDYSRSIRRSGSPGLLRSALLRTT